MSELVNHPYRPEDLRWVKPDEVLSEAETQMACHAIEKAKFVLFSNLRDHISQLIAKGTVPANADLKIASFILDPAGSMSTREKFMPLFKQQIEGVTHYWQITFFKNEKGVIDLTRPPEIVDFTDICGSAYHSK